MATKLLGLLGWPVGHSASPAMMNAAFEHCGIDARYIPFTVAPDGLAKALPGLLALGAVGVNVTIPHKQHVFSLCDAVTEEAKLAGAVNTVRFDSDGHRVIGHNTDVSGWWSSIQPCLSDAVDRVLVLGAGGAVRAIAAALAIQAPHIRLSVAARNEQRAEELRRDFQDRLHISFVPWHQRHTHIAGQQVVVNATPLGMWPKETQSPLDDATCLHANLVVQDIVYRPLETAFLRSARQHGATVVNGLSMLVHQGALAFAYWFDTEAPFQLMENTARIFVAGL